MTKRGITDSFFLVQNVGMLADIVMEVAEVLERAGCAEKARDKTQSQVTLKC
jgi:hypothetical protein